MTKLTSTHKNIALIVLSTVLFVISVADTVLNIALPDISGSLNATSSELLWIVDVYLIVVAAFQITFGSVGDHYGRKRLLQIGLVIFGAGSLCATFSTNATILIVFRTVMALGAAIMMPSTLSILTDVFREPKERAKAIATWSSVFSIGAAFGPIIAGVLLAQFNWSSIFYLNLPIVIAGLIGSHFLPESRGNDNAKLNLPSIGLSSIGLFALVYAIITGGESGWLSTQVLASITISVVFLGTFLIWEKRSKNSMLPIAFFKNMSFTGSIIALTISTFAMMGSFYFFSQYFQSVQGYSPLETSLAILPVNIFIFIFTFLSVPLDRKIGTKATVSLGLAFTGIGLLIFSFTAGAATSYYVSFIVLSLTAIGMGFTMSPATNAIMNSLPPSHAGVGSAMNDTSRQIGGALGIAVLGSLMTSTYLSEINKSPIISGLSSDLGGLIRNSLQSAIIGSNQLPDGLAAQVIDVARSAFVTGLREALLIGAVIMFVAAVAAVVLIPSRTKHAVVPVNAEATMAEK